MTGVATSSGQPCEAFIVNVGVPGHVHVPQRSEEARGDEAKGDVCDVGTVRKYEHLNALVSHHQ